MSTPPDDPAKSGLEKGCQSGLTEDPARAGHASFRDIFAAMPCAVFVCDRSGIIQAYNLQASHLWGREPKCGDPNERFCGSSRLYRPDGTALARAESPMMQMMSTGAAVCNMEVVIERSDGSRTTVLANCSPLRDAHGEIIGGIATLNDITDYQRDEIRRHKHAAALLEGEAQVLGLLAEGVPLAEILLALVRLAEKVCEGMLASVLLVSDGKLHHGAAPSLPDEYNQAVEGLSIGPVMGSCGTAAYRGEIVIVTDIASDPLWAIGREIALRFGLRACWSMPLMSEGRALGTFALYYHEPRHPSAEEMSLVERLTRLARIAVERKRAEEERRRLEAQLLQAQKMESLGVLAGGIAHDFNNLLTSMMGHTHLLMAQMPAQSVALPMLREVEKAAQRAADLTQQMLAYSGRGKFFIEGFRLDELVAEMAKLLETVISKKATLQLDLQPASVEGDATQVRQIVMNLITNASDALEDHVGVIAVRTGVRQVDAAFLGSSLLSENIPVGAYACIDVNDSGCGMSAATLARIFDPFFTTKFTGRGLGLAAVLGIVKGHRGAIKVDSVPGQGTTFHVLLPRAEHASREGQTVVSRETRQLGQGIVLVVEDEPSVRSVSRHILTDAGFEVREASDGYEGLKLFRAHAQEIVAVLLDLTMPRMDGTEVLREIRLLRSDVPVLIMSGYSEAEVSRRFTGLGAGGFLQKPFLPRDLVGKLCDLLLAKRGRGNQ